VESNGRELSRDCGLGDCLSLVDTVAGVLLMMPPGASATSLAGPFLQRARSHLFVKLPWCNCTGVPPNPSSPLLLPPDINYLISLAFVRGVIAHSLLNICHLIFAICHPPFAILTLNIPHQDLRPVNSKGVERPLVCAHLTFSRAIRGARSL
jgi:hypothetical protein